MKYLIDVNILIDSKNRKCPFDLFPSFWEWLVYEYKKNTFYIIDKVKNEICVTNEEEKKDELQLWAEKELDINTTFKRTDEEVILGNYQDILEYISTSGYYQEKAYEKWYGFEVADSWLIATAMTYDYTIVTYEQPHGNLNKKTPSRREPKIPDVADEFGVTICNFNEFLRQMKMSI